MINAVEYFTDNMERRGGIGATHTEENTHRLSDLRLHAMGLGKGVGRAVKNVVFRLFVEHLIQGK